MLLIFDLNNDINNDIKFTNSRIRKSSALIYKCGYTNSRIRKSKLFDLQVRLYK